MALAAVGHVRWQAVQAITSQLDLQMTDSRAKLIVFTILPFPLIFLELKNILTKTDIQRRIGITYKTHQISPLKNNDDNGKNQSPELCVNQSM